MYVDLTGDDNTIPCQRCTLLNVATSTWCVACGIPLLIRGEQAVKSEDPGLQAAVADDTSTLGLFEETFRVLSYSNPRNYVVSCLPFPHRSQILERSSQSSWSCGYKNIQMLCSALMLAPTGFNFKGRLFSGTTDIPDIIGLQHCIESAWKDGQDPAGAESLGALVGTKKWIGATEVVSLLRHFAVDCRVVDFVSEGGAHRGNADAIANAAARSTSHAVHRSLVQRIRCSVNAELEKLLSTQGESPTTSNTVACTLIDAFASLLEVLSGLESKLCGDGSNPSAAGAAVYLWTLAYFLSDWSHELPIPKPFDDITQWFANLCSTKPPVFLQFQGHSVSIAGVGLSSDKSFLVLMDPRLDAKNALSRLQRVEATSPEHEINSSLRGIRAEIDQLQCTDYQIVYVRGRTRITQRIPNSLYGVIVPEAPLKSFE